MRKLEERVRTPLEVRVVEPLPDRDRGRALPRVSSLPVSHSIPESSALVIDTPAGRVVHSGDFKIDGMTPWWASPSTREMFREVANGGRQGDDLRFHECLLAPSRPVGKPAPRAHRRADRGHAKGMVVATTFASNVARLKTLAEAGRANGRSICLLGRAMKRMVNGGGGGGRAHGLPPPRSAPRKRRSIPRENLMLIVTGSQGERRAASAALARGQLPRARTEGGRPVPVLLQDDPGQRASRWAHPERAGREGRRRRGRARLGFYHVSGHANRPDLEAMHDLVRPQILVPNHGEFRHLREHARLAHRRGMDGIVAANGMMVELSGNAPSVVEHIEVGRTYLDGSALIGAFDGVIRDRMKLALNGIVIVALIVDEEDEILEDAWVALRGLPERGDTGGDIAQMIEEELARTLPRLNQKTIDDDDKLEEAVRRVAREVCVSEIGKRPEVTVLVSRLMAE
jgi:ribonuclease J